MSDNNRLRIESRGFLTIKSTMLVYKYAIECFVNIVVEEAVNPFRPNMEKL